MEVEYKTKGDQDSMKLASHFKILLNRKLLLLGVVCVVAVIAGVISLTKPKIFTVDTIIQMGQIEGQNIESSIQVVEKINNKMYHESIALQLGVSVGQLSEIKAKDVDNTQIVKISTDVQNVEKGKEALSALTDIVIKEHQRIILNKRNFLEKELAQFVRRQKIAEDMFQKGLESAGVDETAKFLAMSSIQSKINSLQDQININYKILNGISDTQVVKSPNISFVSVGLKLSTAIILGGLFGLFVGIFIVFLREWWEVTVKYNEI